MKTSPGRAWLKMPVIAVLIALPLPALSQVAGARLEGMVYDSSHAAIPGVTVTATNEGTNISITTAANDSGHYVFVNLPPGTYTLTSELRGFKRCTQKGIILQVGAAVTINITLETGELSAEIVVSAAAPIVDVTSGRIGSVVQERQVVDLPLNGRNPMMLFYLQSGTNPRDAVSPTQQAVGSVDGLRANANNVRVEGVWANDPSYDMSPAAPNAAVPLESVAEYRVTTSSASVESGRGAGAQVSVVYRSGTNNVHGSAYAFNRNTVYNANNFFANRQGEERPKFLRNQYGVSLGGPIKKDRMFFFLTWEGQQEIQGTVLNRNVYTQSARGGLFRYYRNGPNSSGLVDANGNPTVPDSDIGTIDLLTIDPSRQGPDPSGRVAAMFQRMPLPNNNDLGDGFNIRGYRYISNDRNDYNQFVAKVDYTLSAANHLSLAIGGYWRDNPNNLLFSGYYQAAKEFKRNAMLGLISGISPTLTNELRVGATRRLTQSGPLDPASSDRNGIYILQGIAGPAGNRGAQPDGNVVPVWQPQRNPVDVYSGSDSLAWVRRNHTLKIGVEAAYTTKNNWYGGDEYYPVISTDQSIYNRANVPALPGLNAADQSRAMQAVNDLTGSIGYINQTYNANSPDSGFVPYQTRYRQLRQTEYGAFFQDTWKAARNFTLNYGVRWDLLPPAWMANGIYTYPKGGSQAVLGISGPIGTYQTSLAPNMGKDIINWDFNNFGPTVGFTWDPTSEGKMSISLMYRVAYDRSMQSVYSRLEDQNIGMNVALRATPNTRFSDPNLYQPAAGKPAILPLAHGAPFDPIPASRVGRAYALDEKIRTPYTQSWSLRIQHDLGRDWYVQGAYVGNISVGGWRAINYNQVEILKNGFLDAFLAARRNLATNGNPNRGEPIGVLGKLFAQAGGIPSNLYSLISDGQVAALANYIDTTVDWTSKPGGLVAAAGYPDNFFRTNPQVADANIGDNLSVSTWHGAKLEVGKRFSAGTTMQVQYTYGKGLTDWVGAQGLYADYRDNNNRKLDKSLQQYDSTHILQANAVWELPFGSNKRWLSEADGWQNAVFGGWQLNGIVTMATGRPFTVTTNRNNLVTGVYSTANYSGSDFKLMSKVTRGADTVSTITGAQKSLFSNPGPASAGGTPLFAFQGPLYFNVDTSMIKNFRLGALGEQGNMQVRMEAFNVLNRTNFNNPPVSNQNINSGTFGVLTSAYSPRILQFALKLNF
jgi:hypothetical protein